MSALLSARDEPELEQTRYDVVLMGTGLTNTILAGALSKAGCSVLHVDARSEYGTHMASHNLAAFAEFVTAHAEPAPSAAPTSAPSEDQLSAWRSQCKGLEAEADTLSFEPIVARSPFFGGSFEDYSLAYAKTQQEIKEARENEARRERARSAAQAAAAAAAASAPPSDGTAPDAATPDVSPIVPAAAAAPVVVKSPVMSQSRRFSIDLSPHLLFSRSPLIDLLVASGIHQYLEFKAVDHAYFAAAAAAAKGAGSASSSSAAAASSAPPALSLLPLSKSSIFQSSSLSMLEKRQLMKFLHLTLGDDYHAPTVGQAQEDRWRPKESAEVEVDTKTTDAPQQARHPALSEEQAAQPFSAFLALQKLSPQLTQMVLYAVALLDENVGAPAPSVAVTAAEGMDRLRSYLASVGRYGPGAFLYSNYGLSELPQAFVRLSAVNRGVYILRFQPVAIVYAQQQTEEQGGAKKQYRGVLTAGGQLLTSSALVAESDYNTSEPSAAQGTHELFYSRAVLITDGPLAASGSTTLAPSSFFSFAPAVPDESPIYGLQFSAEVSAAPKGHCVIHLYAVSSTLQGSQRNAARLKTLAISLTQQLGAEGSSAKPHLLAIGAYQQRVVRPIVAATPWNGAANNAQGDTEKVEAAAASSAATAAAAAATTTEPAASTAIPAPDASATAPADSAASTSDAPSSAASSTAAVPSPCRPVSHPLFSFAPSASVGLALDESLYDAQSLFAALCPSADFRRSMRTQPLESADDEMALLSQIAQQQTAEGEDEGEKDGEQTAATTTETSDAQEAPVEAAPVAAVALAADAVDPSAAASADSAAPAS